MIIDKLKPSIKKKYLYVIAGMMWFIVGIFLIKKGYTWLFGNAYIEHFSLQIDISFLFIGLFCGVVIAWFGFSKIANKNVKRIQKMEGKRCFFSFIAWKSYLLIIFMVLLGITLRHSPLNKAYLAIIYTSIGSALFLASFIYFNTFKDELMRN